MKKVKYTILALLMLFPANVLAHIGDDEYFHHMDSAGMMGYGMGYGSFWGLVGWVTVILIWIFLILGSIAFWKYIKNK